MTMHFLNNRLTTPTSFPSGMLCKAKITNSEKKQNIQKKPQIESDSTFDRHQKKDNHAASDKHKADTESAGKSRDYSIEQHQAN